MNKRLGRYGFTLVELLAVLVIMAAIMGIAIPSITSSMERNKQKQLEDKLRMLESFAEFYVTDHRNIIYNNLDFTVSNPSCQISISELKSEGYLSNDADKDADDNQIPGSIIFYPNTNSYEYSESYDETKKCNIG